MPRHATSNGAGKCDTPLKTEVPESVADDFRALAAIHGVPPAELLRRMVLERCYGEVHAIRLRAGIATTEVRHPALEDDRESDLDARVRLCRRADGLH